MANFSFLSTFQHALKALCDTEDSQQGFINRVIPFQIFPNPVIPMVIKELSMTFTSNGKREFVSRDQVPQVPSLLHSRF